MHNCGSRETAAFDSLVNDSAPSSLFASVDEEASQQYARPNGNFGKKLHGESLSAHSFHTIAFLAIGDLVHKAVS